MYSFSYLEPVCCSMSSSNCMLTFIQISQETDQVVCYSHLLKNVPKCVVIHTVKGFGIVNNTEIDVFLEFSCFFDDPMDVGNRILALLPFLKPTWTYEISWLMYMFNSYMCAYLFQIDILLNSNVYIIIFLNEYIFRYTWERKLFSEGFKDKDSSNGLLIFKSYIYFYCKSLIYIYIYIYILLQKSSYWVPMGH